MTIDVAARLSSALADRYRVIREIGAGGMATVYLAHDLRHDRDVAIKVLHPDLGVALGADRFLAEIKVTARLQHPHILPLLDSGTADGLLYYVMPLVTGESLRTRLTRETQLPIDVAIRLASEVADALHHAHSLGVIHRDIKPENILLQGGHAVVADFGIALAVQAAGGARMTQTGLSLGTPQYMSPEQAMGERNIDARSDVYELGAVTYEMLTGDPPFMGSTVQAIVAKVLTERPTPPTTIRDTIPAHVEAVVLRALAKLPADRYATAAEFGAALEARSHSGTVYMNSAPQAGAASRATRRPARLLWVLGTAGVAAAAVGLWRFGAVRRSAGASVAGARVRFELALPDSFRVTEVYPFPGAVSPDGSEFTFAAQVNGGDVHLFRRRMDKLDATPLPAAFTETNQPIYSPDGKYLAAEGTRLRKVRLSDGEITEICACSAANGGDWGEQGEIVLGFEGRHRGLSRVSANGGTAVPLTQTPKGDSVTTHIYPMFAGSSDVIVFSIFSRGVNTAELAVTSLRDGTVTPLGIKGVRALAVQRNKIIFSRADGVMMSVGFDASSRKVTGVPVPVQDALVVGYNQNGNAAIALGRNGGLVALERHYFSYVGWVRGNETPTLISHERREYVQPPRVSPDGTRIVAAIGDAISSQIWVTSIASGAMTRISTARWSSNPEWSTDGRSITYLAADGDSLNIVRQSADGGGSPTTLAGLEFHSLSPFPSPDGSAAIYRGERSGNNDVRVISLRDGLRAHGKPFVATQASEWPAAFSPDGRWVAMYSDESGRYELSIRSFPDPVNRLTVSSDGIADRPFWSRDGRVLYYPNGIGALVALHLSSDSIPRIISREVVRAALSPQGADTSDAAVLNARARAVGMVAGDITADGRIFGSINTVVQSRLIVEPGWRP